MHHRLGLSLAALALLLAAAAPAHAADEFEPQQWNLATIGAPSARAVGTGDGARIAVIDSGVDLGHPDLAGKVDAGPDYVNGDASPQDDNGHGTHVAGVAAAHTGNGTGVASVAPGARIVAVKVLDGSNPPRGTTANVEAGIRWATQQRVDVINLSLGGNVVLTQVLGSDLTDAINDAWAAGIVVVVASGNDALPISGYGQLNAIVVAATTRADRDAPYSNGVGSAKWGLAAPGGDASSNIDQNIISTYWFAGKGSGYAALAGTSMATPHVAGAAAVLRKLGLTPQQTVDRLLATAKDLGAAGRDSTYGSGRLDLGRAVQGLGTGSPAPTTAAPGGSSPTTARPGSGTTNTTRATGGSSGGTAAGTSGGGAAGEATAQPDPLAPPDTTTIDEETTTPVTTAVDVPRADVAELAEPLPRAGRGPAVLAGVLLLAVLVALPRTVATARRRAQGL